MRLRNVCAVLALGWMGVAPAWADDPTGGRPTDRELREVVRSLLGSKQDPNRCAIVERAKVYSIECRNTECHTCNVTHVITTLRRKEGRWVVAGSRRERRGDTGECGCCM